MRTICEALETRAETSPGQLLFQFRRLAGSATETHTYHSFRARVDALAAALEECAPPGARALIAYPPGLEGIAALLACARVGLIGVPVPPSTNDQNAAGRRLLAVAADCNPAIVLTDRPHRGPLERQLGQTSLFTGKILDTEGLRASADVPRRGPGEVFLLQYTSGSTGQPRGVVVTHENLIANARATLDHCPIGVSWLPQHHDMGLIGYYIFPILAGGTSYGMAPADFLRQPAEWLRLISEVSATYASAPNFGFEHCLRDGAIGEEELTGVDLSSLRVLMNAAEPARPRTIRAFYRRFRAYGLSRAACTVAYGLAENTLAVTLGGRGEVRVSRARLAKGEVAFQSADAAADGVEIANCGRPPQGVTLAIRDCATGARLGHGKVGEIEVGGPSVTPGYWPLRAARRRRTLRTGDLGFVWNGDLYVCGRLKDVLIVAGANYYPQDLERAAEESELGARLAGVCALQERDGALVLVDEVRRRSEIPDAALIATAVSRSCGVRPDRILLVPPRTIARTTSGKIARSQTRGHVESGTLEILAEYDGRTERTADAEDVEARIRDLFRRAGITDPLLPIGETGIDSLTLTELHLGIEALLAESGTRNAGALLEGTLLQDLSLEQLLHCLAPLRRSDRHAAVARLERRRAGFRDGLAARMRADRQLGFAHCERVPEGSDILLTGATGFFGAFLLSELLRQTPSDIHVVVRCATEEAGLHRVREALARARILPRSKLAAALRRIHVVPGDLEAPQLGLSAADWETLAGRIGEIYHNGARVNYVAPYNVLRGANVEGTRTALQLAFASGAIFHHISTTFVFGWTRTPILHEHACNADMEALDFGYAQSKWVAEQLVLQARTRGIRAHVYRPSLLSVSTGGVGDPNDVAVRTLAFMINHRLAVDTLNQLSILPVDQAAMNLVAVSRQARDRSADFHVVADRYYNIVDLTEEMARVLSIHFTYLPISRFLEALNALCRPSDPVYPLLDFFNRSGELIAAMTLKRYDSSAFRNAKSETALALDDPPNEVIARLILEFLHRKKLISPASGIPRSHRRWHADPVKPPQNGILREPAGSDP